MITKTMRLAALWLLVAAMAACASQKAPAEAAVKAAQDSVTAVAPEAQKYVPDQFRNVQNALSSAQGALAKNDYAAALTQAQAIPGQVAALQTAIADRKMAMTRTWNELNTMVPQLLAALKSRVDILAASKGVPKGLTRETVEAAKTGTESATRMWADAGAAVAAGDLATAAAKATETRAQVVSIMQSLNMQIPTAPK
jgi:hypothetical protein